MVFSSFRVWLAVGEFVREGQVPFLYCSFWFMKSGKRVLGSTGEHMPVTGRAQGVEGEHKASPLLCYGFASRGAHGGKAPSQGEHKACLFTTTFYTSESSEARWKP